MEVVPVPAQPAAAKPESKSFQQLVEEKTPYYQQRIRRFEEFKVRENEQIAAAKVAAVPISIVLPDGAIKTGIKNVTTPLDVANEISKSLAKKCVVATVDTHTWDMFRPLEDDCALALHSFDDPQGRDVSFCFWLSVGGKTWGRS